MAADNPLLNTIRTRQNDVAILFIHGFSGNLGETWGMFPFLLAAEPCLEGWDIFSLGYSTRLLPGLPLWTAQPSIAVLAELFQTHLGFGALERYRQIAVVAHSMGGLVVQRAILDNPRVCGRTSHLFLFGTPSNGLAKASVFKFWTRQVRDLGRDSAFIKDLIGRRPAVFGNPSFEFATIAGDIDNFVPPESSLDPFDKQFHRVVRGNHLEIVKPEVATELGVQVVVGTMCGAAAVRPRNAARVAVEHGEFKEAILQFAGTAERLDTAAIAKLAQELDAGALVQLALALEETGRREEALELLELHAQRQQDADPTRIKTDPLGTLAGRLKRRWLLQRHEADGERARDIYAQAYDIAAAQNHDPQAFYMAINAAFIDLALAQASPAARQRSEDWARKALDHTRRWTVRDPQRSEDDKWRWATEGEAHLILGDERTALERYRAAIALRPEPRELSSMYQQAYHIADLLYPPKEDGSDPAADFLDDVFRGRDG